VLARDNMDWIKSNDLVFLTFLISFKYFVGMYTQRLFEIVKL